MSDTPFSFPPATTPEPHWVDLCGVDELQVGVGRHIRMDTVELAVFKLADGTICVIDDCCPHAGASLAHGHVENDEVICPRHAWFFNLKTGRMPDSNLFYVPTFAVEIKNGRVLTDISRPIPMEPMEPPAE
ncbi:MAG: Rieske 2Fe-2S domain-containing protein [Phycisphaerae bacterium]